MRRLVLLCLSLMLSACASPLPPPDPAMAWVDLRLLLGGEELMADRLDDTRWPDSRYFQVSPGQHELEVRYRFEYGGGGLGMTSDPSMLTCHLQVRYDDFAAGGRYVLQVHQAAMSPMGGLYENGKPVADIRVLSCGPV